MWITDLFYFKEELFITLYLLISTETEESHAAEIKTKHHFQM